MALFYWKGPGQMEEVELARTVAPELTEPAAPAPAATLMHVCVVEGCKKAFPKAGLAARHFNKHHPDLFEDKDSWRNFVEEHWR